MRFEDQAEHRLALKIATVVFTTFISIAAITVLVLYAWRANAERWMLENWMSMLQSDNRQWSVFVQGTREDLERFRMERRLPPMFRNLIVRFSNESFTLTTGPLSFLENSELALPDITEKTYLEREFFGRRFILLGQPFSDRTVWLYASSEGELGNEISKIIIWFLFAALAFVVGLYFMARYLAKESFAPLRKSLEIMGLYNRQIAHELRTPLAVLKSDLELSRYSNEPADIASSLEEVETMEKIIDSLLFLAENPKVENPEEEVDLKGIFQKKWDFLSKKHPQVSFDMTGESPKWAKWSPELLSILAGVLLENAATHSGEPVIRAKFSESGMSLENAMKKEMPKAILEHIFEPFFKFDSNGSGLGLSIAKKIVEAHGWVISFNMEGGTARIHIGLPPKKKPYASR